jgi:hypothetical protein
VNDAELLALYEKLYLHEIEMREKITSRVQTPLTLVVTLAGVFAFLLQRYDYLSLKLNAPHAVFMFFAVVAIGAVALATLHICNAWVNNEYKFMPLADQTAKYREDLKTTYAAEPNAGELVDAYTQAYVVREYVDASSFNARVNDFRSNSLDRANQQIVLSATMLLVAFAVFQFGDLDRSKLKTMQEVTITKPVDVRFAR